MRTFPSGALVFFLTLMCPRFAGAEDPVAADPVAAEPPQISTGPIVYFVEAGASLFNSNTGFIRAKAANVGASYRFGAWSLGLSTGANFWRVPLFGTDEQEHVGVVNLGPVVSWTFAQERARAALAVGWSRVIEPSAVDASAGSNGFYIDARPIGLRLPAGQGWTIGLDPLSSALRVPDTTGVPLVEIQFMTWLRLEVRP